jgi:GNAT superfamily N-acetyltransferase
MNASVFVDQISELPDDLEQFISASVRENFRFLERLRRDWESGDNRFANLGEALFVAQVGGRLVGVCGLNRDPYSPDAGVGRLRRLYVLPQFRRQGVARCLVSRAMSVAREHYASVRLRTDNVDASRFYEALGFEQTFSTAEATHEFAMPS